MDDVLSMVKGDERFIFRYRRGEERLLFEQFKATARDKKTSFEWSDAFIMAAQLNDRMSVQLSFELAQLEMEDKNF